MVKCANLSVAMRKPNKEFVKFCFVISSPNAAVDGFPFDPAVVSAIAFSECLPVTKNYTF